MRDISYVILAVLISSCKNSIKKGEIIEKYYEPPRYYNRTDLIMLGKMMTTKTTPVYDDEDWIIVVKGVNDQDTLVQNFLINKSDWQHVSVGDIFNDSIINTNNSDDGPEALNQRFFQY